MADPLTIVGGVAAVIDLISFGYKIVSLAIELKRSTGEFETNKEKTTVAKDIEKIVGNLRPCSDDNQTDPDIEPLRQKALNIATELYAALAKLRVEGERSTWIVLKVSIRNVWDKNKISELDKRLQELSLGLNTRLTANSSQMLKDFSNEQKERFASVQEYAHGIQETMKRSHNTMTNHLNIESDKIQDHTTSTSLRLQENISEQIDTLNEAFSSLQNDMDEVLASISKTDKRLAGTIGNLSTIVRKESADLIQKASGEEPGVDTVDLEKRFDEFAKVVFCMIDVTHKPLEVPTLGHRYSGAARTTDGGIMVEGNLGPEQSGHRGAYHTYSGQAETSRQGIHIRGNINNPDFAPWNRQS